MVTGTNLIWYLVPGTRYCTLNLALYHTRLLDCLLSQFFWLDNTKKDWSMLSSLCVNIVTMFCFCPFFLILVLSIGWLASQWFLEQCEGTYEVELEASCNVITALYDFTSDCCTLTTNKNPLACWYLTPIALNMDLSMHVLQPWWLWVSYRSWASVHGHEQYRWVPCVWDWCAKQTTLS